MNSYVIQKSKETGISIPVLSDVWKSCENSVRNQDSPPNESHPDFIKQVMNSFNKKLELADIQSSKEKIMSKEKFQREGNDWLNALASDNYVTAKEKFPSLVQTTLERVIEKGKKEFLQNMAKEINEKGHI